MFLTEKGKRSVSRFCERTAPWPKKWNGIWYVLFYDVPEKSRRYRDVLRSFLKRMRMGCLQRSVWITPHDVRPAYQDLADAVDVQAFSVLLESRTVLGQDNQEIVCSAWNMEGLYKVQQQYLKTYSLEVDRIRSKGWSGAELVNLARQEQAAYLRATNEDPLLPRPLWPDPYLGERVFQLHHRLLRELAHRI